MELSGIVFLLRFLPIFMICYFAAPGRIKNFVLLLGSLCFFAWKRPAYVLLILFVIVLDYISGLLIGEYRDKAAGRISFLCSILMNIGLFGLFGYADFFMGSINALAGTSLDLLNLAVPFGLAVYTLQSLSYLIDVYRGKTPAQKNILECGMYLFMFPQLAAGPVVKYHEAEKFLKYRNADLAQISGGFKRICIGLAKKVLLADTIGELWLTISQLKYLDMGIGTAWLGVLAFALQLYFAMSGYADMAIGLGACMGFGLPENFHYPFMARSVGDFFDRWNITLGQWLREYVYLPMGGSNGAFWKKSFNVFVYSLLMGLWYGADAAFVLWGVWLAVFLLAEKLFLKKLLGLMPDTFGWLYTTMVMAVGWVLFAMHNLQDAGNYLKAMFGFGSAEIVDSRVVFLFMEYMPVLAVGLIACTPIVSGIIKRLQTKKTGACMAMYRFGEKVIPAAMLIVSLLWIAARGR